MQRDPHQACFLLSKKGEPTQLNFLKIALNVSEMVCTMQEAFRKLWVFDERAPWRRCDNRFLLDTLVDASSDGSLWRFRWEAAPILTMKLKLIESDKNCCRYLTGVKLLPLRQNKLQIMSCEKDNRHEECDYFGPYFFFFLVEVWASVRT